MRKVRRPSLHGPTNRRFAYKLGQSHARAGLTVNPYNPKGSSGREWVRGFKSVTPVTDGPVKP